MGLTVCLEASLFLALCTTLACLTACVAAEDFPPAEKLPAHPDLPDPLLCLDGSRVTTREQWEQKRRPELLALFQHYMYGYWPPRPQNVSFRVARTDRQALGGKATLKEITITFGPPGTPPLHLLLVVPNQRRGPAPVFVGLNFCGNHTVLADPQLRLPESWLPDHCPGVKEHRATEAGRGAQQDVWSIAQTLDRGYAVATCYCGDIDPDRPEVRQGIQPHLRPAGQRPGPHDWGTIAAWAWGLQRLVDYLQTDPDIDPQRIIVVGHSRLGKAALLAGAADRRFALVIPHQSGCGGAAPSRTQVGETVRQINERFPHWFAAAFRAFNDHPERLPFDQHCLIALCAPRPVLLTNAVEDTWANPRGQFDMLRAAEPVYRLLGAGGLADPQMPPVGKLSAGTLGYWIRPGQHSMTPQDWQIFVDFAERHLSKKASAP